MLVTSIFAILAPLAAVQAVSINARDTILYCNGAGYSPSLYSCINGKTLCPAGDQLCGTQCYSPSQYTCYNIEGQQSLCPAGTDYCGPAASYACFDPTQYACENGGLVPFSMHCT